MAARYFTAGSYSRWSTYQTCPAQAKYKFLDKLTEPPSDALARGTEVHTLAEMYIKGKSARLPRELATHKDQFRAWRRAYKAQEQTVVVEGEWGFAAGWSGITAWNDWNKCWWRTKVDYAELTSPTTLKITDHKTGRPRPDKIAEYNDQLELYVLSGLVWFARPELTVTSQLAFLDYEPSADVMGPTFSVRDLPRLRAKWLKLTKPFFADRAFKPKPGNGCRWCSFSREKNGPCKF